MDLNASEWIALLAILVTIFIPYALARVDTTKKIAIMEEKIAAQANHNEAQDKRIDDVAKAQEGLKQAIHTVELSLVRIESHMKISTDVLGRVENLLQNSKK